MSNEQDLAFPEIEYRRRVDAVRCKMAERGVDLLLVDAMEHVTYLFGYTPPAQVYQVGIIPMAADPVMIVRGLDEPTYVEQSWVTDYVPFADWEDGLDVLGATLKARGWVGKTIGVELDSNFLTVERYEKTKAVLPEARFIDFSGVVREVRLIKSDVEIALLRKTAKIADAALLAAVEAAGEGVAEREVAAALYSAALKLGADNGRTALIASGRRSDKLHGALGLQTLAKGDMLHIESIPACRTYGVRLMRSSIIGEPPREIAAAARQLIEIQDEQYSAMRPGVIASDVDKILREKVLRAGLRERYTNTTGYTLGIIASPKTSDFTRTFMPHSNWVLEAGMVFHMYCFAKGMAFSDTMLVTQGGAERLTKVDRRLFVR